MRPFLSFLALLAAALIIAAALTYPAWLLVGAVSVEPVHRVMKRLAMLLALVGLVYLIRRHDLADRVSLGYGQPRREFLRQLVMGWLCGIALMIPLAALLLGLDVRQLKPGLETPIVEVIVAGILSGLAVAFIEETVFRGALFTAVARTCGVRAAAIAPSLLYAALHFVGGKLRVPPDEVSWIHGFAVLGRLFDRYADPMTFVDSFAALAILGVLLALVRLRTGAIAACIGLHAAGVCAVAVLRETTVLNPAASMAALAGTYDGVIGWAALVWFAAIGAAYAWLTRNALSQPPR
ncbi:MAG TPA: CPBP family intramembrane glutamic endopeptidase [Steroidobacter sp.]|jgi:hypothetical protein|nr:CPBP family intramembrane glutamic endopeptidase [Steroidobacter sp.]